MNEKPTEPATEPVVESKISLGARKVAKKIAHDLWNKYEDPYKQDKQDRNNKVSVYDQDCMIFFFGQFDPNNQMRFLLEVENMSHEKHKAELITWIHKYYGWYRLGDKTETEVLESNGITEAEIISQDEK